MSHIIFGDFSTAGSTEADIKELKKLLLEDGVLLHLNDEIDFYQDVYRMLAENSVSNSTNFCLTSSNQKFNSEDLLFPYDKYTEDELFPDGEDRRIFEKLCSENILALRNAINIMLTVLKPLNLRVFVAEGYDDGFKTIKCNQEEMIQSIISCVRNSFHIESTIYELN